MQVEHLVRCMSSPYQQALFRILQQQLTAEGDAKALKRTVAISNTVMELRNICNHPTIRLVQSVSLYVDTWVFVCLFQDSSTSRGHHYTQLT
jgi:hypothetical protein